jgi:hypothetical protein
MVVALGLLPTSFSMSTAHTHNRHTNTTDQRPGERRSKAWNELWHAGVRVFIHCHISVGGRLTEVLCEQEQVHHVLRGGPLHLVGEQLHDT